jgi:hypothetical protein
MDEWRGGSMNKDTRDTLTDMLWAAIIGVGTFIIMMIAIAYSIDPHPWRWYMNDEATIMEREKRIVDLYEAGTELYSIAIMLEMPFDDVKEIVMRYKGL